MLKSSMLTVLALGLFAVAAGSALTSDAQGAQWYPFYGYNRPSYLSERCTVPVQPASAKISTANCPPAQDSASSVQPTNARHCTSGARWYPFYGNNRPSYLDQ